MGVSLYEALAGTNPFQADELAAVLYRVVHEPPAPLGERNPEVSPALQATVERAMAKDPEERFPTARALADALNRSLDPAPDGAVPRRRGRGRRAPMLIGTAALVLAAGGGWAVWSAWSWLATEPVESTPAPIGPPAPAPVALGAIRVTTNTAVDVLVDGEFRARSDGEPLVIGDVLPGERVVTLRLGAREQSLRAVVRDGETVALSYSFPEPTRPASADRLPEDLERRSREALDRLRGTVDRAQRDAAQKLKEALDRAGGAFDRAVGSREGGKPGSPKPEPR